MAKSVIARKTGDSMQAYFFWLQACQVFLRENSATSVGYEINTHSGFDDVVLYYEHGILIEGKTLFADYYQIKYHIGHKSGLTALSLSDPAFIGTGHQSILSRLMAIYIASPKEFGAARYHFVTTWGIDYNDVISDILREDGTIASHKLFAAGPKSKYGIVREAWLTHLNTDQVVLKTLLDSLYISAGKFTFEYLKQQLLIALSQVGLKPVSQTERSGKYEELIDRLHSEGKTTFDKQQLSEICITEGLVNEQFNENLSLHDYQLLHELSKTQVENWLIKSYFAQKYKASQYVKRGLEKEVSAWIELPISESSTAFLILASAGSGKTNTLAQLAGIYSEKMPTFLFAAPLIHIGQLGLWEPLKNAVDLQASLKSERIVIREYFRKMINSSNKPVLIIIDAINEFPDPVVFKRELEIFISECAGIGIRILLSCRNYYWNLFEAEWWSDALTDCNKKGRTNQSLLGNYTSQEASIALGIYFASYNVSAKPSGNAIEQFRHPLLLRFFCETYSGRKFAELSDVRLKNLFDNYWAIKLKWIAQRIINQGGVERAEDIEVILGNGLKELGLQMLERNSRGLDETEAKTILKSDSSITTLTSAYGRLIDEHIVIEEIEVYGYERKKLIAFVFEEFMEYTMARGLIARWQPLDLVEICRQVEILTGKYQDFNQIFGVLLYAAIMAKEQRNFALWPALIGMGSRWQSVVIEAFKRLPADQIDDTVFNAIIELLQASDDDIQIQALELLKFGRLKRAPTKELTAAVGSLVTHGKLPISRRAVIALSYFPAAFSIPFIELAIAKSRSRVNDEATIVKNSLKTLAILNTQASRILMCNIIGGYWRIFRLDELVDLLGKDTELLISLLDEQNILIRLGAIIMLGTTKSEAALKIFEERLQNLKYNQNIYYKREFPNWTRFLGVYNSSEVAINSTHEKKTIESALSKLKSTLQLDKLDQTWREKIGQVSSSEAFSSLPYDLSTITSVYPNLKLILFIIKSGLELRSTLKWSVTRSYGVQYIQINAPKNRLIKAMIYICTPNNFHL